MYFSDDGLIESPFIMKGYRYSHSPQNYKGIGEQKLREE